MNTIVSRALWGTLLAGGITLLGATVAQAAERLNPLIKPLPSFHEMVA